MKYSWFVLFADYRSLSATRRVKPRRWLSRPARDSGVGARRPVSRVLSAPCDAGRPFLWDAHCCAPHATNPGDRAGMPLRHSRAFPWLPPAAPIRSCSRWGLPCRPCCQGRGALLPHRFTLAVRPAEARVTAVCSLWHFPWGRPRRPLAGTVFSWSPDFPPPESPPAAAARPSGAAVGALAWGECQARRKRADHPHNRATASKRANVPASACPVTASGRQCRWNARSTLDSAGSSAPSASTR
jgi:hypothetical protein